MDPRLFTAVAVVVGVPAVLVGYIYLVEFGLRLAPARWRDAIRPWFWLAPALLLLTVFLILPTIQTIVRSFQNNAGTEFIGLDNYAWFFSTDNAIIALRNSALWVVFLTLFCVGLGLIIAILVDRVRYESVAKSVIFVPLAISMVAAGVIWRFMYAYEPPGTPQTGFLNGVLAAVGVDPVPWLTIDTLGFNTILLIVVMTWMWTGFAMVILSAALKGISAELLEAARVDGATEWRVFRHITFPLLLPTVAVVSTTIIITALKAFDIVYTMTNGAFSTDNIALLQYKQMNIPEFGRSSAVAVILLLAIVPIMALNINRFRAQEALR